ncbi:MAG TPA: hypothetical protein PKZ76_03335 [Xanthomonadaceae bacterium]|nr:hypothetical protein [Xanthomonadaceae bacterium]
MLLADFQSLVDDLVRDKDQVISSTQRNAAVANALARYSVDAPLVLVEDVVAPGGQRLPAPPGWIDGQSAVRAIEYPVGQIPAMYLDGAVGIYRGPDGDAIELQQSLGDGETARVFFTSAHVLDAATTTIPPRHQRAVAALAAADLCGQLASHYASEGEPTIQADAVDHQGKSGRFRNRARDLRAEYVAAVGTAPSERNRPASVNVPLPSRDALGGRRIFHPPSHWPRA